MKWFLNLKISVKLLSGFFVVALIAGIIGVYGVVSMRTLDAESSDMYAVNTVPIGDIGKASVAYQRIRINLRDLLLTDSIEEKNQYIEKIDSYNKTLDDNLAQFEGTIKAQEIRDTFNGAKALLEKYKPVEDNVMQLALQNKTAEATGLLKENNALASSINDEIDKLVDMKIDQAKTRADNNTATANSTQLVMIILIVLGVLLAIAAGIIISRMISIPVRKLAAIADKLAVGDVNVNVDAETKDEIGELMHSFGRMIANTREQADAARAIADGELGIMISPKSENDILSKSMELVISTLNRLMEEADGLIKAAIDGQLGTRGNAEAFKGGYRDIVLGINNIMDAVINPLNQASAYVQKMADGERLEVLANTYKGDFGILIDNLNQVRASLNTLLAETEMLSKSAVEGKLSVRGDMSKLKGSYADIVQGINNTLDAVIEPIKEASAVLGEMAEGNLCVSMNGNYSGDHSKIKEALNKSLLAFNEVMGEINRAADQVSAGAKQVSDSSQSLSQGTTEQASSIEEITSSITQIAAQTKQNAVNAGQANELAVTAKNDAISGNNQMWEMLKSMEEINESSGNISKIIKVIDEIAFQTNILALNAAVEAARAGQHGKGFAVVAEEVRNLAARSANAAKETTMLIEGSIKKVEAGTRIANNTAEALSKIVEGASKAAELVAEIADASNEQATGITQVDQAITQVSQVTQTNTATAEQSASASEELAGQADTLKTMIGRFRIRKAASSLGNYSSFDPEVVRLIEGIVEKKNKSPNNASGEEGFTETKKEAAAAVESRVRIALDDKEFGKY